MNTITETKNGKLMKPEAERRYAAPDVNIYETDDAFILEAEMPGVRRDGLEITLEGNTLTFVGNREDAVIPGTVIYRETRPTHFRRSFELDPSIDTDKIAAEMRQGLLTLTLPKLARVKLRKIEIK